MREYEASHPKGVTSGVCLLRRRRTMDEALAETDASDIACEASRELTLASDVTAELYSIVALPDGWTHALPAISAVDIGSDDGALRVAYARADGVEVWQLAGSGRPDAMLARYEASTLVAALRISEGTIAWIDGQGRVQVAFPEQPPPALGTGDAVGTLRLKTLAGGALVAVEGSDPQRVSLYRVCR